MVGWSLNVVYCLLLVVASPVLLWRGITQGKYRHGWREKLFGRLPQTADGEQVIWLHAVSVGEVLQLRAIVSRRRDDRSDHRILITTTTHTGHRVARETFPECSVAYLPLDFTWAVKAALRRVRPVLVGLVELELWPNLIRETSDADIPLMLINGRISERSYSGYRQIRFLMRPLLQRFDALAVQTEQYAARLTDLGAPPERVTVTGSVKFDCRTPHSSPDQSAVLRTAFGIQNTDTILVAGSTHEPEEAVVLDAWQQLQREFPRLRLILVPRHQERFDAVAALVVSRGHSLIRRSESLSSSRAQDACCSVAQSVCLLDTLGELSGCWGLADIAFVGGSLNRRGGQNMIEPAACGIPVIVGPNTSNFRDVVEGLGHVRGIRIISRAAELTAAVRELLTDPLSATRQGAAAQEFVKAQQGAARRTLEIMRRLFSRSAPQSPRQVA